MIGDTLRDAQAALAELRDLLLGSGNQEITRGDAEVRLGAAEVALDRVRQAAAATQLSARAAEGIAPLITLLAALEDRSQESGTEPCPSCGSRLWAELYRNECDVCSLVTAALAHVGLRPPRTRLWDPERAEVAP